MKTKLKITYKQYLVIAIAIVLFVIGAPNITSGLSLLRFLDNPQVPSGVVWRDVLTTAGFGFVLVGIGIVLLFKLKIIENLIHPKNKNWLLVTAAIFLVGSPWFHGLSFGLSNEVMIDGMTVSATIVITVTLAFSLASWSLLSWASKSNIALPGALLGIISGASLVNPFLQVLGPMAAVIVGVVAGFVAFMLQQKMNTPEKNRPLMVALTTLGAAYFVLSIIVLAVNGPHIWDTSNGIGAWSGTPEGMERSGFDNVFGNNIGFESFLVVIPALIITVLVIRREKEHEN